MANGEDTRTALETAVLARRAARRTKRDTFEERLLVVFGFAMTGLLIVGAVEMFAAF